MTGQHGLGESFSRRRLLALGGGVGLLALAGCSTTSASSTSSAGASGASVGAAGSAAASPTATVSTLKAGTYKATFGSGASAAGGAGGAGGGAGGAAPSGMPSGAKPSGAAPSGGAPGGTGGGAGGAAPSGGKPSGSAPSAMPSGSAGAGGGQGGGAGSGQGGGGGQGGSVTQLLSGAYLVNGVKATIDGGTWTSTKADQNVFLVVNGGSLTLTNATIVKSGNSSNEDACNFYGLNSAVLVVGKGSTATMTGCTVKTAAEGSNAVFAASSGKVTIDGITISTTKGSSRGLDGTYSGQITASDVDITTKGQHCACLATDRGAAVITVTGDSTLSSAGNGSPLVYSTGDISVTGATGTATGAGTMVIEGKNQIAITDCTFTSTASTGMMIYQSFSGDAADSDATASKSSMTIKNSTVTANGTEPMIYVTNTNCQVNVSSSRLVHKFSTALLSLAKDQWGTSGSNGGHAAVTFSGCTLTGAMSADSISKATVALKNGTKVTGSKVSGSVTVTKDSTSSLAA